MSNDVRKRSGNPTMEDEDLDELEDTGVFLREGAAGESPRGDRQAEASWSSADESPPGAACTPPPGLPIAEREVRSCSPDERRSAEDNLGRVSRLTLTFSVSRDEEYVRLHVSSGGRTVDLGARSRNYLLLTLARRRLEDAAQGLPETACGWVSQDELAHDPTMNGPHLNVDVFRLRKQFDALGVADAENIIERRARARQLRIGTGNLVIARV